MELDAKAAAPAARLATAAAGGVLVALSMPPWGLWPLAFVGVATFDLALTTRVVRPLAPRSRGLIGFVFAVPWMLIGMAWMWFLTAPGYVITALSFAALHAIAAAMAPIGPWGVIGRPAAHTLAEIVRILVPFGGVPLATLGISQAGGPLLGLARVGGVVLLSWAVFQTGTAFAVGVRSFVEHRLPTAATQRLASGAIGAVVVAVALAAVAPSGRELDAEPVTIAAVQGGGEQGTSALEVPSSAVTRAHLDATAAIEPNDELDLVVWPENGIDVNRAAFADSQAAAELAAEAARLGVPISVGVTVDSAFSAQPREGGFVNAQYIVTPEGRVTDVFEKVRIVPFGEYVPLRGILQALGAPLDQIPTDAVRGRDPAVIETPEGVRLGVMISWEVFFGDRGRAAADGEILINPTNGASYTGTIVQTQQVASSRLRAIETGRWLVQVSPTGFSAFVTSDGAVLQRTDVSERAVITADVPRRGGTTWYTATGDAPWVALVLAVLAVSIWFGGANERFRPRPAA